MEQQPKPGTGDVIHTITKAGLSAIPVVGGPAAVFFAALITPPIIKRRDAWVDSLGQDILKLKEKFKGFDPNELQNNEPFVTAVLHATDSASKNHDKEKLEFLRNAVLNVALKIEPNEDLQLMFFNYIDVLTRWHLKILSYFSDPKRWYEKHGLMPLEFGFTTLGESIEHAFQELKHKDDFYKQLIRDLNSRGLLAIPDLSSIMSSSSVYESRTTDMGDKLIRFILSPLTKE